MMKRHRREIRQRISILPKIIFSVALAIVILYFSRNWVGSLISLFVIFALLVAYSIAKIKLNKIKKVKKMEASFPDFLQLVSSNLRAGMTIDKALLLSSRKDFAPLDQEINLLGKDLVTGKQIARALKDMATRINSEKIKKTTDLIISGIRSGGDISILLEQTATTMREREFVEKKSASNVLMYVIFIFFAIAIGAPTLFSLSAVLVQVLTGILSNIPVMESTVAIPFTLTEISVSVTFITYFSIVFLVTTNILGALVIGLVREGEEREGLKYIAPLIILSLGIFFAIKILLLSYFTGLVG